MRLGYGSVTLRVIPDSNFSCVCPVEDFVLTINPVTWAVEGGDLKFYTVSTRLVASLAGTAAGRVAVRVPVWLAPSAKLQAYAACAAPPEIENSQVGEVEVM